MNRDQVLRERNSERQKKEKESKNIEIKEKK